MTCFSLGKGQKFMDWKELGHSYLQICKQGTYSGSVLWLHLLTSIELCKCPMVFLILGGAACFLCSSDWLIKFQVYVMVLQLISDVAIMNWKEEFAVNAVNVSYCKDKTFSWICLHSSRIQQEIRLELRYSHNLYIRDTKESGLRGAN